MSAEDVANAFINHFYTTWDNGPQNLTSLYQGHSKLTFEGQSFEGPQNIIAKYMQIGKVMHDIPGLTKDVQMSVNQQSMLIFVTGKLKIDTNPPLLFSQMFQLVALGPGQYYVHNDMFRLIYA